MLILLLSLSLQGLFSFFATDADNAPLVRAETIEVLYQPDHKADFYQTEIDFWSKKWQASPEQLTYALQLAAAYEARFSATASIGDLKAAEALLTEGLAKASLQRTTFLRALARNYISQHQFQAALALAEEAMERNDTKLASTYLLYDVMMEIGRYDEAEALLQKMYAKGGFAYLIRKAKWEDHQGNLTFAVHRLEEAKAAVNPKTDRTKAIWLYSNLADFYGHQGEIGKAYEHYRMTLELDPANWYAYKGLAWIAYAHDDQPALAQSMVHQIMRHNDSPDLHLFLAELYTYQQAEGCAADETQAFQSATEPTDYGIMYRIPNCEIALEEGTDAAALAMALAEVRERPTPETYDLLAWVYYQTGDTENAQSIARQHVWQKTFEPVALSHLQRIFPTDKEIQAFTRQELLGTQFELGPVTFGAIEF